MRKGTDRAPWLLLPAIFLTLSSVTLLTPRRPVLAAPKAAAAAKPAPPMAAYDDGDGDELLEHWGDPKVGREARLQMAGMMSGFLLLGAFASRRRFRSQARRLTLLVTEADDQSQSYPRRKAA